MGTDCEAFGSSEKTGMVFPWRQQRSGHDDCGTRMRFRDFDQRQRCEEFSVIPRHVLLALFGAQKNYLWQLREQAAGLVRPQSSSASGFVVRRYAGVRSEERRVGKEGSCERWEGALKKREQRVNEET